MYRFLMNRCWALILTCVLGFGLLASVPARSLAGAVASSGGGSSPDPSPTASGDPDSPSNTGRPSAVIGRSVARTSVSQAPTSPGEAWTPRSAWVIKIRTALNFVRVFYLHD
jgi:hypothetical protein